MAKDPICGMEVNIHKAKYKALGKYFCSETCQKKYKGRFIEIGFNAKKGTYEDLTVAGVIDPTKVVRSGIQNAASIAAMVLTTEALVTDFDDEKDQPAPMIVM